jgi:uncharacterized protein (TIGR02594 family)
MTILDLQMALRSGGFDTGPLDGIAGPKTRSAIRAFQASKGLVADGIAGPKTQAALFASPPGGASPANLFAALPWLAEAKRLIGTTEAPGPRNNQVILDWADAADIPYDHDEIAWCGLFVAHCIAATLPEEPLPAGPLGARNWLKFGMEVPPQLGAVMVFWRGSVQGWSGHVALYWAEDAANYHVLGGNQSDAVTVTKIAKSRFLGARWPISVAPLHLTRTASGAALSLSTNEA